MTTIIHDCSYYKYIKKVKNMVLTDEEMDKMVNEEIKKDIDQSDSINEEQVETHLGEMGFLWDTVPKRLHEDSICFKCKKEVDFQVETCMY